MIVVKLGGGKGIDYDSVLKDLATHKDIILVHGGNYELGVLSTKLGKPPRMVTSVSGYESRLTDRETLSLFEMVYCGKINKMIVEKLLSFGKNALGLSGIDGRLLVGRRKPVLKIVEDGKKKLIRDDYTGKVETCNTELLKILLAAGYTPVITPPAISYENEAINVDGDRAAAVVASGMKADSLIILSDVPGLLKDPSDERTLIRRIDKATAMEYMEFAKGRMKKKVMGAVEALNAGVKRVIFGDARIEDPVTQALGGQGTLIE